MNQALPASLAQEATPVNGTEKRSGSRYHHSALSWATKGVATALGRQLVADALKNQLTPGLKEKLLEEYALTPALIIEKVYRQPFPSRFLASLSPFLHDHIEDTSLRRIITGSFDAFFERNVMQYDYRNQEVHFVGSVAWYYADLLKEVAAHKEIRIGEITQSPMAGLIRYHHAEEAKTPKL